MSQEICANLYKYVKKFHENEDYASFVKEIDCQYLIPKLRLYQEDAVKWMLYKEKMCDKNVLPKEFEDLEVIYPKGGILADEMGLGKTVEMLALILNNQFKDSVEKKLVEVQSKPDIIPNTSDIKNEIHSSLEEKNVSNFEVDLKQEALTDSLDKIEEDFILEDSFDVREMVPKNEVALVQKDTEFAQIQGFEHSNDVATPDGVFTQGIKLEHDKLVTQENSDNIIHEERTGRKKSSTFLQYNYDGYSEDDEDDRYKIESDEDYIPEKKEEKKKPEKARKKSRMIMTSDSDSDEEYNFKKKKSKEVEGTQIVKTNLRKRKSRILIQDSDSDEEFRLRKKKKSKTTSKETSNRKTGRSKAKGSVNVDTFAKCKKSENYQYLKAWYEQALSEVNKVRKLVESDEEEGEDESYRIKCHCSGLYNYETIQCECCGFWQHIPCVGVDNFKPKNYYCPSCWVKKDPIKSKATFIISPDSIVHQWQDEIKRHVKKNGLKVVYYEGAKGGNYVQPEELTTFDIVITTYSVLCNELNYCGEREERRLRYKKKFHSITSPLTCISWWRLCLDEAQMVESPTTRTAEMVRCLHSNFKWAVTGTPIQKSLNDLYGLVQFFGMEPFTETKVWNSLVSDEDALHYYIGHLLWRSRKEDVYHMLGVPPQTVLTHWLKFTPVEGYFYQRTHDECATHFREKLARVSDLNSTLVSLDRVFVNRMMQPLLRLRQACIHPQAVDGKFRHFKGTITMEDLLTDMTHKVKQSVDIAVRTLVASLNGQAGIKILLGEWNDAVSLYRSVLQLQSSYPKNTVSLDTLQKLHTLHNLADILSECQTVDKTLHDDTLGEDALKVEQDYLQKYENAITKEKIRVVKWANEVERLSNGKPLGYSDWWQKVIVGSDNHHDIVDRVRTQVLDHHSKFPIRGSYSNKIKNIQTLYGELATWLAEIDDAREEVINNLKKLQHFDTTTLCQQALSCHLRNIIKGNKNKCRLCQCENKLLSYETMIFEVMKQDQEGRKKNIKCLSEPDVVEEPGSSKNRETEGLQSTTLLDTKKEGNWKPSQMERIIQVLVTYAKQKKYSADYIHDGSSHLNVLEAVRKEFKSLRALWTYISDQVAAYDELSMAKLRFRLPLADEVKDLQKKKIKEPYIIQEHEIVPQLEKLQHERIFAEKDVGKNIGILMYLFNLQKDPNQERDPCPICRESLTDKWSVLRCGHCLCFDCIPSLLKNMNATRIECAICREKTSKDEVAYVDCNKPTSYDEEFIVKGSPSTKVEAVIVEALRIKKNEPNGKILIFSAWEKVLDVIGEAFDENEILYKRLVSNKTRSKQYLEDFKTVDGVTALLLPLKLGSKGLNLVEATHLFFVEPILNPGEELQAVGRIHRIGQTKKTYVHRFVIHNTIEERMLTSLDSSSAEWSSDKVTVKHLHSLFSLTENSQHSLENSQTEEVTVID